MTTQWHMEFERYKGSARAELVIHREVGNSGRHVWLVSWLRPTARHYVDIALSLFVAGMILGGGMLTGAGLVYMLARGGQ